MNTFIKIFSAWPLLVGFTVVMTIPFLFVTKGDWFKSLLIGFLFGLFVYIILVGHYAFV